MGDTVKTVKMIRIEFILNPFCFLNARVHLLTTFRKNGSIA